MFCFILVYKSEDAVAKYFMDLPSEIIEMGILVYLNAKEVQAFGMTGNARFKHIADNVVERRRE